MQHQTKNWRSERSTGRNWKRGRDGSETVDSGALVFGKMPPQALELEEAVLGALMLEKGAFDTVGDFMRPEFFYRDAHQKVFSAMRRVGEAGQPVDILTVVEALKKAGELEVVGGPFAVTKLTNQVVSSANVEAHARIIQQKFIQREMIRISGEIIAQAYENTTDVFDLLDQAETGLFSISTGHLKSNYSRVDALYEKETAELEQRMELKEDITGVPSGFKALDAITAGWQPEDLIILAARPSMGKTAYALNLAKNAALYPDLRKRTGVGVFSLEMSRGQVMQRLISAESGIPLERIRRGKLDTMELRQLHNDCAKTLALAPIFIDDTPGLNIFELRAKARRMVQTNGVGLIIIDYLQLMSGAGEDRGGRGPGNREQEISKISRSLKALAKELHVPVIALSQLSRDIEKRSDGKHKLSDLRESGAIEQDADLVAFLSRSGYQKSASEIDPSEEGDAELDIKKHRNGRLEIIAMQSDLSTQRFIDIGGFEGTMESAAAKFIPRTEAEKRFALDEPPAPSDELPF